MSNMQWVYNLVDSPFFKHRKTILRKWLEGDTDVPKLADLLTGRVQVPAELDFAERIT